MHIIHTHTHTHTHIHTLTHTHTHSLSLYLSLSHTQLVQGYGLEATLIPSRGLFARFSRPKKSQMEEMQGKLEELLMTIVHKFDVPPMELLKFVEYPFTVSTCTCSLRSAVVQCTLRTMHVHCTCK